MRTHVYDPYTLPNCHHQVRFDDTPEVGKGGFLFSNLGVKMCFQYPAKNIKQQNAEFYSELYGEQLLMDYSLFSQSGGQIATYTQK